MIFINTAHQLWMKSPHKNSGPSLRVVSDGSVTAAFFVEGSPNCALACLAPATCVRIGCPHGAMVSLCKTAEDATEAIKGEVPMANERRGQGKAASRGDGGGVEGVGDGGGVEGVRGGIPEGGFSGKAI